MTLMNRRGEPGALSLALLRSRSLLRMAREAAVSTDSSDYSERFPGLADSSHKSIGEHQPGADRGELKADEVWGVPQGAAGRKEEREGSAGMAGNKYRGRAAGISIRQGGEGSHGVKPGVRPGRPQSAPVTLCRVGCGPSDEEDDNVGHSGNGETERLLPHELIARQRARSDDSAFSVMEGAGRTLKGRDASRVRDAVWLQTGFFG